MGRGTQAFSRNTTRESDLPQCCDRKLEGPFNCCHGISLYVELSGNMMSFQLTAETSGSSRVSTGETRQRFPCEWNIRIPLQLKKEIRPSSREDLGYTERFPSCCADFGVHLLVTVFSGNLWSCLKEIKPPVVLVGKRGVALETMQGIWASYGSEGGHLMVSLELRWEPGVSSRVTMGMFFKHSCFLSDVRSPV